VLVERRNALTDEIAETEAKVDRLEVEDDDHSNVFDLHKEANQLEYELGRLETNLERVEDDIADIKDQITKKNSGRARVEDATEEMEELRTKIDRIEHDTVDEFNEHMDTMLEQLDYANLDRI
jgi:predicted  nucleic acid-binding Zn-ribbon protein